MGRTIPTVNQVLEQNREQWKRFYRALRREDRALLDELFDGAKYFTAACVYQVSAAPSESIFLAMLLHLQKQIRELQGASGVPHEPLSGMDTRLVPDGGGHGRVAARPRREPPLLLG
jgi:hypothetical protein